MLDRAHLFITLAESDAFYFEQKCKQNLMALTDDIVKYVPWIDTENDHPGYVPGPGSDWYFAIQSVFRAFSGPRAADVGKAIRSNTVKQTISFYKMILTMCFVFDKIAIPLPVDTVLCRFYTSSNIERDFRLGSMYSPKGFFSCTYKETFLDNWLAKYGVNNPNSYLLIVALPRGFPILPMRYFSDYGAREGEMIIPFNTAMQVTRVDQRKSHIYLAPVLTFDPSTRNPYRDLKNEEQYKAWAEHYEIDDYTQSQAEIQSLADAYAKICGFDNCA